MPYCIQDHELTETLPVCHPRLLGAQQGRQPALLRLATILGIAGGLWFLTLASSVAEEPIKLTFPVDCKVGLTCEIQNYVDQDPSQGVKDFACGTLTYDGHNGTDIRIPSMVAQRSGVSVLAAAGGRVTRVRDGVPDVSVRSRGLDAVRSAECGNGLVIDHGDGWETQYCHMANGSIAVSAGAEVPVGATLGKIGLSGLTEYPHLHFTVRHRGKIVDPFAFESAGCSAGKNLWAANAPEMHNYRPTALLNAGFAERPITSESIEGGDTGPGPSSGSPLIIFYTRLIGLKAGDVQELVLIDPNGRTLARGRQEPVDRAKAQYTAYVGIKRPPQGWTPGRYRGSFTLVREGRTVLERTFDASLELPR